MAMATHRSGLEGMAIRLGLGLMVTATRGARAGIDGHGNKHCYNTQPDLKTIIISSAYKYKAEENRF